MTACGTVPVGPGDDPAPSRPSAEGLPPADLAAFARTTRGGLGRWVVAIDAEGPFPIDTPLTFELAIERADPVGFDRADLRLVECTFDATMPHHGHGMNVVPTIERTAPARFRIEGVEFSMEGEWLLTADVRLGALTERVRWWVEAR